VRENLEVARRLHPGTLPQTVGEIMERLDLAAYADRRASTLSHGNSQRLGLAKAMLHTPQLLILDEPANGLDPAGIVEVRELLRELARQGGTVFMSSHILAEVARLANRIGFIHNGHLLQELTTMELERNRRRRLLLRARDPAAAHRVLLDSGQPAEILPDGMLAVKTEEALERPDDINRLLVEKGLSPTHLRVDEEDLEQYFLRLVGMEAGQPDA
jgi:ABC-2 type transport system ATP-binding protein